MKAGLRSSVKVEMHCLTKQLVGSREWLQGFLFRHYTGGSVVYIRFRAILLHHAVK